MSMIGNSIQSCRIVNALIVILIVAIGVGTIQASTGIKTYGYFSVNYEDVGKLPDKTNSPGEFTYPHLNLMFQATSGNNFRTYVNLSGDDADVINVRNYWGEYVYRDYLKFRAGKIYRPFDLFNEKLDAVPTYLGIEPPELFDKDHLLLPRTDNFLVHGNIPLSGNMLKYAVMTGNSEIVSNSRPVSWDLNYNVENYLIGTSGYYSNEKDGPVMGVGEGSPNGGILPWMASDKYSVLGGYAQAKFGGLLVQGAYWTAKHNAVRDPAKVLSINRGRLNQRQLERFGLDVASPTTADVKTEAKYDINTYYIRFGYTLPEGFIPGVTWELTPFLFLDYYSNPETIAKKSDGGDNEAGVSDDGKFTKPTIGIAIRPNSSVALKIDASTHQYKWTDPADVAAGSKNVHYEEIRFDLSFFFE